MPETDAKIAELEELIAELEKLIDNVADLIPKHAQELEIHAKRLVRIRAQLDEQRAASSNVKDFVDRAAKDEQVG